MRRCGVTGGIVVVTILTVGLELAVIGASGIDVNPLHIAQAHAQTQGAGDRFPPDTSGGDCDNDADGGADVGEIGECLSNSSNTDWFGANQDLFFYGAAGLAAGVLVIGLGLFFLPEVFATAGLIATFGTASEIFPAVYFSSSYYVMAAAISGIGEAGVAYFGASAADASNGQRALAATAQGSDIALPAPVAVHIPTVEQITKACGRVRRHAVCRTVALAGRTYALALARTVSVAGALAVTVKRLRNAGNDPGRQTGTAKVLALRLLDALTAQQAVGRAYAAVLRHAHIDVRLSAAQVRRVVRALGALKGVPKGVVLQLQHNLELSTPDLERLIRRTLARTIRPKQTYDFVKELERPVPVTGLRESYESMNVVEVSRIVAQLNYEKRISGPDTTGLVNDLLIAQRACTPLQRSGPIDQFVADVRAHVTGPYERFLLDAAVPLYGNHPYPNDLPPTAAFIPTDKSGQATAGHPFSVTFHQLATDDADHGRVGCWEWNFGDPSSGANNVAFQLDPVHDYARPGVYSVTMTAVDDDGFARTEATGRVTVNP
jgi:hypothetical protein